MVEEGVEDERWMERVGRGEEQSKILFASEMLLSSFPPVHGTVCV